MSTDNFGVAPVSVLVIDDDALWLKAFAALIESLPDCNYQVTGVTSAGAANKLLRKQSFDICVVDVRLPDEDGISLIRSVRNRSIPTPSVLVTGIAVDRNLEVQAVLAGASDMIYKDEIKESTVRRVLHMASLRKKAERRMREAAIRDPMTGCYNRKHLLRSIAVELKRRSRTGADCAVIYFDVDGLKQINDKFGHSAGDRLLKIVSQQGQKVLRTIDCMARMGGDEFAVLLPDTDSLAATKVAEKLLIELRRAVSSQMAVLQFGASFGVAGTDQELLRAEELMQCSDTAMLAAKRAGKNRIQRWSPLEPGL